MENHLLDETLRLVRDTDLPLSEVCRATGIKPRWLYRLMAGDFADPGVNKIERLHRYLSARKTLRDSVA